MDSWDWQTVRRRAQAEGVSPSLVLKEQIHLLILDHLFRRGAFSDLVFQGGTALRIAYRGIRFSEDLDFVLTRKDRSFPLRIAERFKTLPSTLERHPLFGKDVRLKEQKSSPDFVRFVLSTPVEGTRVRDRTHLEVTNVPSYANQPLLLQAETLPARPAVRVETPREILADKVTAFGAREFVKGRDLWDIHFLMESLNVKTDRQVERWVRRKISDYRIEPAAFRKGFGRNLDVLRKRGAAILRMEMDRFLPAEHRELLRDRFPEITRTVHGLLTRFRAGAGENAQT